MASDTTTTPKKAKEQACNVLIAGGGPAGLAAALSLARRGYTDIQILERNPSASFFEVDKAYLYRIDGRGQRLTGLLGITDKMKDVSVTTEEFLNITIVSPDASVKTVKAPADPSQQTAYWLPRRALISFLVGRIEEEGYGKQIKIHWDVGIEGMTMPRDTQDATQSATVHVRMADGNLVDFTSQKILGCDVMNSRIRLGLESWAAQEDNKEPATITANKTKKKKKRPRFGLHFVDSPSAGLRYKILTLQDGFPLTAKDPTNITDKSLCYSYVGTPKGYFTPPLRLGLLPYKMKNIPRTANIITKPNAEVFTLKTGGEVLAFLRRELPQCDIERMITPEEAERFAKSPGGYFPHPQYCLEAQQVLGGGQGGVVLLGDAIHAFPPDLGAGVNLALLDVLDFIFCLDHAEGNWQTALPMYENLRAPQSKAICELIPIGFPQQYNHMLAIQKSIKLAGVAARVALNKLCPWLIAPPVFFMCQDVRLDYHEVLKKATRSTRILKTIGLVLVSVLVSRYGGGAVAGGVLEKVVAWLGKRKGAAA